jgi:hypothetical protein
MSRSKDIINFIKGYMDPDELKEFNGWYISRHFNCRVLWDKGKPIALLFPKDKKR